MDDQDGQSWRENVKTIYVLDSSRREWWWSCGKRRRLFPDKGGEGPSKGQVQDPNSIGPCGAKQIEKPFKKAIAKTDKHIEAD